MLITRGSLVRAQPDPPRIRHKKIPGGLAQLGEHLLCKQGVVGSIPSSSTIKFKHKRDEFTFMFSLLETTAVSFFNNLEEVKFY